MLPLNSPPRFPCYNGAIEKSIRDFKAALVARFESINSAQANFTLAVELTAHNLNHRTRRASTAAPPAPCSTTTPCVRAGGSWQSLRIEPAVSLCALLTRDIAR